MHFRTWFRSVPFYISEMVYELKSSCCAGYLGNVNDPQANPRCIGMYVHILCGDIVIILIRTAINIGLGIQIF